MHSTETIPAADPLHANGADCNVSLNDSLTTAELAERPSRPPDYAAENNALVALARGLAESPQTLLQKLVDTALALCGADSAGISILEPADGGAVFRWNATAGAFARYCGGTMPREFSPCGIVLDRDSTLVISDPARFFPSILALQPPIIEALLVPFHQGNIPVGTVWILAHRPGKQFESEDARLITSLAQFASAAVGVLSNLKTIKAANETLRAQAIEAAHVEAERRENEEYQRFAAEAGRTGSWYVRLDTMECVLSPMMAELMGFPIGQTSATSEQWRDYVFPEDLGSLDAAIAAAMKHDAPFDCEFRLVRPDGIPRWLYSHGGVVRDAAGKAIRLHGASVDISDRKRDEKERLRLLGDVERQARIFDTTLSSIADFAYILDRDARFVYANKALLNLWGIPLEAAIGKDFFDLKYPEPLAAKLCREVRQVFETGTRLSGQTPYTSPTGFSGYYEYIFSPVFAADGTVEALAGSTRDMTEQKRVEERERQVAVEALAAAEANAKFRTFFDQGTYFAGVMTLDGTIVEANRLCLDACGFTRDQVIGRKFWECGWWNRSPALVEMVREGSMRAAGGHAFRLETAYFIHDGTQREVDLILTPVTGDDGRILFVAATGTDITERKLFADEREKLLDAERAIRAEAETANRAKDKFLAVLSHELRTPLSPVVMTIPAMEFDPEMPFKFREDLAMVRRNIDLEVKLIDDLLDLSRVTSGKLRLQMQPVIVHELLRHALHNSLGEIAGKRLNVRQEFAAGNDHSRADPARLQQVFWNLLRNAVKFTPEGGDIIVRTWNGPGNERLHIEVRDTGVGIAPEVLPRIFDAFEQGEMRMTRQFGGLGLGLAIAKAVVEMHGGKISAASAGRGLGAAFTVVLETAVIQQAGGHRGDAPLAATRGTAQVRLLLVEDHPDTARTLAALLKRNGYEVRTAGSVAAALQLAATERFDVLISDIGLPDATGYELMEQIRDRHGIQGIALSGYGMEEDMRKSREAGFAEHVVKPVDVTQLQAVIRGVMDRG